MRPPRHALADVVVRLADELELDAVGEERAEALPGEPSKRTARIRRGRQPRRNRRPIAPPRRGADGAVAVADRIATSSTRRRPRARRQPSASKPVAELAAVGSRAAASLDECVVAPASASATSSGRRSSASARGVAGLLAGAAARPGRRPRRTIAARERRAARRTSSATNEQVGHRPARACRRTWRAAPAAGWRSRLGRCRRWQDRTIRQPSASSSRGAEAVLVRTEQRRDDDIAARLEAAVDPERAPGRAARSPRAPAASRRGRAPTGSRRA